MNAIVVYESRFGNTATIARAIAAALEAAGTVGVFEAADATAFDVAGIDLLVVGGPTEGHGLTPTLRARLADLPSDALRDIAAAAFDTRLSWPAFLAGSAAKGIARILQQKGARLIVPAESFLVTGMKRPRIIDGEIERAGSWAERIRAEVAASTSAIGR